MCELCYTIIYDVTCYAQDALFLKTHDCVNYMYLQYNSTNSPYFVAQINIKICVAQCFCLEIKGTNSFDQGIPGQIRMS